MGFGFGDVAEVGTPKLMCPSTFPKWI